MQGCLSKIFVERLYFLFQEIKFPLRAKFIRIYHTVQAVGCGNRTLQYDIMHADTPAKVQTVSHKVLCGLVSCSR